MKQIIVEIRVTHDKWNWKEVETSSERVACLRVHAKRQEPSQCPELQGFIPSSSMTSVTFLT